MAQVHLEFTFALSVAQVVDAENELYQGREVRLGTQLQADKLQIWHFVDSLVGQCKFAGVIRNVKRLAFKLLP